VRPGGGGGDMGRPGRSVCREAVGGLGGGGLFSFIVCRFWGLGRRAQQSAEGGTGSIGHEPMSARGVTSIRRRGLGAFGVQTLFADHPSDEDTVCLI
jgi:hypothetical protein